MSSNLSNQSPNVQNFTCKMKVTFPKQSFIQNTKIISNGFRFHKLKSNLLQSKLMDSYEKKLYLIDLPKKLSNYGVPLLIMDALFKYISKHPLLI